MSIALNMSTTDAAVNLFLRNTSRTLPHGPLSLYDQSTVNIPSYSTSTDLRQIGIRTYPESLNFSSFQDRTMTIELYFVHTTLVTYTDLRVKNMKEIEDESLPWTPSMTMTLLFHLIE